MKNLKQEITLKTLVGKSVTDSDSLVYKEYRRQWLERPARKDPDNFPLHIDLESTSACNLNCSFCWARGIRGQRGFIERKLAQKIFQKETAYGLRAVKFNLRGEPLLHPEIHSLVSDAKEEGLVDVFFNTNGLLLDEKKAINLINAGLDRITISCEGYNVQMYKMFREGGNFDTLVRNVKMLKKLKQDFKTQKPLVRVQTVALPQIVPLFDKYADFWKELVDEVCCTDYQDFNNKTEEIGKDSWICPSLFQRMSVLWDGTILACDRDLQVRHPLGNIKEVSLHEVWTGDFMRQMRQLHISSRAHEIDICRACVFRYNEIQKQRGLK